MHRNLHRGCRRLNRTTLRRPVRCLNRSVLRGRRRGPDDLSQAITALGRGLRAYRRLVRLAPSFFDSAVRNREAENREAVRRWMATWEPYIAKAYGVEPSPPDTTDPIPPLPSPKIQRQVERQLAEREMWLAAGRVAMDRYRQRRPHHLMSWHQIARLLELGFAFKRLACGLDSPNRLPDKIVYDYELTNLKRSYGLDSKAPAPPVPAASKVPDTAAGVPIASRTGEVIASCAGGVIASGAATVLASRPSNSQPSTTASPSLPASPAPTASPPAASGTTVVSTTNIPATPPAASKLPDTTASEVIASATSGASVPTSYPSNSQPPTTASPPLPAPESPPPPRCDAWSRLARQMRLRRR